MKVFQKPAGRVRRHFKNPRVGLGGISKTRGSSRVGSGGVVIFTGRLGSRHEVFNITGRAGSPSHDPAMDMRSDP